MNQKTKKLVIGALLAAFTTISTMIIKFPTPTFGYIHLGDGLVILCGIILGPLGGALSAGIGSMFADIFSGYMSFAFATLVIKALAAMTAGFIFHKLKLKYSLKAVTAGIPAELLMVLGYFIYEVFLSMAAAHSVSETTITAGISASLAGVPFNIIQGVVGIVIAAAILPILLKIADIRDYLNK